MGKPLMNVCNMEPNLALARSSRRCTAVCGSFQGFKDLQVDRETHCWIFIGHVYIWSYETQVHWPIPGKNAS